MLVERAATCGCGREAFVTSARLLARVCQRKVFGDTRHAGMLLLAGRAAGHLRAPRQQQHRHMCILKLSLLAHPAPFSFQKL